MHLLGSCEELQGQFWGITTHLFCQELFGVFQKDDSVYLFDAKYGKFKETPQSGYQYQMYFYAMAYKQQVNSNLSSIAL